nr:TlpA disulfide reductase family protein [Alistipes sp. An116]
MKDVLKDDVVIVSFWATWCKPCQSELDALYDIEEMWKDKVRIITVSTDDSRATAKVRSLVKGKRWPYEVLLDQNKVLFKALNLTSIPFVMIIKNGETIYTHTGYTPGNERLVVQEALNLLEK